MAVLRRFAGKLLLPLRLRVVLCNRQRLRIFFPQPFLVDSAAVGGYKKENYADYSN